jgi:serine/threonine-protein kinase
MTSSDPKDTAAWLVERAAEDELPAGELSTRPDRLRALAPLGEGGMGVVEVVHDRALDRRVAKKSLRAQLRNDAGAMHAFVREARLGAQLAHPNVAPIHDIGQDGASRPYFTMQLVVGRSLDELLASLAHSPLQHPPTLFDLLTIVTRVCDALAFAHSRGVVHCDVKPANVMVCDYGAVYLVDWGIARVFDAALFAAGADEPPASAGTGDVAGSPAYMAPEQASGLRDRITPAADIFALGGLLYEMLGGRPPYVAPAIEEVLALARSSSRPRLSELTRVPKSLERMVDKAMAHDPHARYASAEELKQDLVRFMRGDDLPIRRFQAGELIVREGEIGRTAYVIDEGRCEAFRTVDERRFVLREMGPGEVFGEMAILNAEPRTASVMALEDTTVREVSAGTLELEVGAMKPWMSALIRTLAERFRSLERKSVPPDR